MDRKLTCLRTAFALATLPLATPAIAQQVPIDEIPENLTTETVDAQLLQTVRDSLPEGSNVDASFLNPSYDPTLRVNQDASIYVTFVDEGAGYRNSLGYFSYSQGAMDGLSKADIDVDGSGTVSLAEAQAVEGFETGWVFPNASKLGAGGQLEAGDTVAIGDGKTFEAGSAVGFFLVQNGWTGNGVRTTNASGTASPQTQYTLDYLNPEAAASATELTDSSTNSSRHVAMLFASESKEEIIMGFEDLNRVNRNANDYRYGSDEDFNDAVFIVKSDPVEAIQDTEIATAPGPLAGGTLAGFAAVLGFSFWRRR